MNVRAMSSINRMPSWAAGVLQVKSWGGRSGRRPASAGAGILRWDRPAVIIARSWQANKRSQAARSLKMRYVPLFLSI